MPPEAIDRVAIDLNERKTLTFLLLRVINKDIEIPI